MKLAKGGGSWVIDFDFRLKVECSSYEIKLNIVIKFSIILVLGEQQ